MATQKHQITKQLRLPPCTGHDLRVSLLHLKRAKHPQAFPQLGELPSLAGLLLYPDKRENMVTTTKTAFGPKTCARTEPKKTLQCNLILEGDRSFITTHQEAYQAQHVDAAPLMTRKKSSLRNVRTPKEQTTHYQTNYRQNFLPPQGVFKRRLQALPLPDNLAVNPALRTDYRTVQMETYPSWDISLYSHIFPAQLRELHSLKDKVLTPRISVRKSAIGSPETACCQRRDRSTQKQQLQRQKSLREVQ